MEIKGVIFDYGGTLDSFGDHWSEVIYEGFIEAGVTMPKEDFRKGYVYAERLLASTRLIFPGNNFLDLMRVKTTNEVDFLYREGYLKEYVQRKVKEKGKESGDKETGSESSSETAIKDTLNALSESVAQYCYAKAKESIAAAKPVLDKLYELYPLVLVSNFYGNIESVLLDMGIRHYFKGIIESSNVGVRKPDPRIFALGLTVLDMPPQDVVVIGDSYKKDIQPALSLGCQAIWIKGRQWSKEEEENPGNDCTVLPALQDVLPLLTK